MIHLWLQFFHDKFHKLLISKIVPAIRSSSEGQTFSGTDFRAVNHKAVVFIAAVSLAFIGPGVTASDAPDTSKSDVSVNPSDFNAALFDIVFSVKSADQFGMNFCFFVTKNGGGCGPVASCQTHELLMPYFFCLGAKSDEFIN